MASVARVLLLALCAAAVTARPPCGFKPPTMQQLLEKMTASGCLPEDFVAPDFSACESLRRPAAKIECVATSSGFSGNSGYDQAAAEAFIDARSSDQQWTARQKELLSNCSALSQQAPAEKQGVFVQVCWTQLTIAECNRKRLTDAAVDANPESGEEVAEQVALMAEGHCLKAELEYSQEVNQAWKTCAAAGELDGSVLMAAGAYYKMLAKGSDSLPELTAENVTNVDAELKKINGVIDCYAQASGEVSSDGAINYDTMLSIIDAAKGKQHVKDAAKKVVEHCQEQAPESISEFYECFAETQPYACVALRSYAIISGRAGRRSCNRNGRSIAAP